MSSNGSVLGEVCKKCLRSSVGCSKNAKKCLDVGFQKALDSFICLVNRLASFCSALLDHPLCHLRWVEI